jgi:hypothetical protein
MIEHDYRMNRYVMAGFVLGYEQLNESVMPLGGSVRLMLPYRQNLLFAGGTVGYMISLENPDDYLFTEANGGFYLNPELGIILPFSDNGGVVLAVGYRYGRLNYLREYWWEGDIERTVHYNRLSIRLGISLY